MLPAYDVINAVYIQTTKYVLYHDVDPISMILLQYPSRQHIYKSCLECPLNMCCHVKGLICAVCVVTLRD